MIPIVVSLAVAAASACVGACLGKAAAGRPSPSRDRIAADVGGAGVSCLVLAATGEPKVARAAGAVYLSLVSAGGLVDDLGVESDGSLRGSLESVGAPHLSSEGVE